MSTPKKFNSPKTHAHLETKRALAEEKTEQSRPLNAQQKAEMMRKEAQDSRTLIEALRAEHTRRMAAERKTYQ